MEKKLVRLKKIVHELYNEVSPNFDELCMIELPSTTLYARNQERTRTTT